MGTGCFTSIPVKLYLVRHADAVSEDVAGSDDARWLSARGREAARGLSRLLREQNIELDAVVSSPLPRAMQTAELVAGGVDYLGVIEAMSWLAPGCHPRRAADELAARGRAVLVVGHEPTMSALGAWLLGRPSFPPFRTAQCAAIESGKPTFTSRADIMQTHAFFVE